MCVYLLILAIYLGFCIVISHHINLSSFCFALLQGSVLEAMPFKHKVELYADAREAAAALGVVAHAHSHGHQRPARPTARQSHMFSSGGGGGGGVRQYTHDDATSGGNGGSGGSGSGGSAVGASSTGTGDASGGAGDGGSNNAANGNRGGNSEFKSSMDLSDAIRKFG